ncbi:MAG: hypothetical protein ACOCQD_04000 [archaeon]
MYKAEVKFITEITENITDSQTSIPVKDIGEFPDEFPNIATLIDKDNKIFETIEYTGKSGNDLTGVTRAIEGVAQNWGKGITIGRFHTALEQNYLLDKTDELSDSLLDKADLVHQHDAEDIVSGTLSEDRLPSSALIGDTTYTAGNGLSLTGTEFDVDNPFNPSGNYSELRAQATTKGDVGLGNVDNYSRTHYDGRYAYKSHTHSTDEIDGLEDISNSSEELIPIFAFTSTQNLSYNSEGDLVQVEEIRTSDNWRRVEDLEYSNGDLMKVTITLYDDNNNIQKQIEEELNYTNGDLDSVTRSVIV